MGKACYVINCAPEMDYLTMASVFKGLGASGSWGCFDEFNRLVPEVLSVCTVQFKAVCDGVRAHAPSFFIEGDELSLNRGVGVFITMNPGYLGRSELPEGLKSLFRPITVMVPDFKMIIEITFMAEGFSDAKALAQKFGTLYELNKDLLSKAPQYDWGMRAIKSVLVVAGANKRANPELTELAILKRSLRDTNVPKLGGDDLTVFMGLLEDLFPDLDVPRGRDLDFEKVLAESASALGYSLDEDGYVILKTCELIELLTIRHSIFLMGPPGGFKSAIWKILQHAKDSVGDKTMSFDISPKALTSNELYGYVNVVVQVEPKKQALKAAVDQLEAAETQLAEVNAMVNSLEAVLKVLEKEFGEAVAEKNKMLADADKCQSKLNLAQLLIGSLGANGVIWEQTMLQIEGDMQVFPGSILLACSFVSYLGVFTRDIRLRVLEKFADFLTGKSVGLPPKPDPLLSLTTEAELAQYCSQGLPSDRVSMENASIIQTSQRWCIILDPQMQGVVWLRTKEASNNLVSTRMGHPKMVRVFEAALEQGSTVLIEGMNENVDAVLSPILGRTFFKRGSRKYLKLGDKEIPCEDSFRLFMQTKLSNPHFQPEIQAECTLVNFSVTESGLEDQLLLLLMKLERSDLAAQKLELIEQQNAFKVKLASLEAILLEKLSNAQGDVLEDVDLIMSLDAAKKTSDEVKAKMIVAQETETVINLISENYRPTARQGSRIFFNMIGLARLHSFYRFNLEMFVKLISRTVCQGNSENQEVILLEGPQLTERAKLLETLITENAFTNIRQGLLNHHKLILSCLMLFQHLSRHEGLTAEELNLLINLPADPSPPNVPDSLRPFISDLSWAELQVVQLHPAFKTTSCSLLQNMEQDVMSWARWQSEEKPEATDLPRSFRHLGAFHRLILLRCLRPDRLPSALVLIVNEALGPVFTEESPFEMATCHAESSASTPFLFILFPGVDPTVVIQEFGETLNKTSHNGGLINISMGQGQEQNALHSLQAAAREGHWVLLQNIHLMQSWLKELDEQLEGLEEGPHPEFRVFLTSEPPNILCPHMQILPESIIQRCIRISNESPSDLKSNLRRAFAKFSQAYLDQAGPSEKTLKSILFSLCLFHGLIIGRKKFGPQGWSRNYPFNDGDLTICGEVLQNYLGRGEEVPWGDLKYIFGEIMYGGHITDAWDRRCNNTYLNVLMKPELLSGMQMLGGFKSPDVSKMDFEGLTRFVEEKLPVETPQMFGLHANAEIGYVTQQGRQIFECIRDMRGSSPGGSSGGLLAAKEGLHQLLSKLPEKIDLQAVRDKVTDWTPFIIVSCQESEKMNTLILEMECSLTELDLGIRGALNTNDGMEALAASILMNQVPACWAKLAYPSLKSLSGWFADLHLRMAQLKAWTSSLEIPVSIWISGLANPMGLLTAVMQKTARSDRLPLDAMTLCCRFTNVLDAKEVTARPEVGSFAHGLFSEGAAWKTRKGEEEACLVDPSLKELHPIMPVCQVRAIHQIKMSWDHMYHCPVFVVSTRGPTYLFCSNARIDAEDTEDKWILAGAAFLLSDD